MSFDSTQNTADLHILKAAECTEGSSHPSPGLYTPKLYP